MDRARCLWVLGGLWALLEPMAGCGQDAQSTETAPGGGATARSVSITPGGGRSAVGVTAEVATLPDDASVGAVGKAGASSLCGPCSSRADCVDPGALCVHYERSGEPFCGQDCREQSCPSGYHCVDVSGTSDARQCAPTSQTCRSESDAGPDAGAAAVDGAAEAGLTG